MALFEHLQSIIGNWWLLALYSLVLVFLSESFRSYYRLRKFQGPPLAGFSKIWLIRAILGGKMHMEFANANWKYGSLARIGPNDLVTNDIDLMRRMLAVRSPYRRGPWYIGMRFDPRYDNVESQRDDDKHTELRGKMAAGYSGKEVEDLEQSIDREVAALVNLVEKYVSPEYKPLDFGRKASYFTLDVISSLAYGKSFGFLAADSDVYGYIKATEEVLGAAMVVTVYPWLNWLLRLPIIERVLPSPKDEIGFGKVMGITKQVVKERFGPDRKIKADMLGSFVRHGLTQDEAESETILQIIAGDDTTATAVRATFLYITTTPRVLSKLRAEFTDAAVSSPIRDAEARQLLYLQAVIKEGLRLWPPVVGLMAKEVPPEGDMINGMFVPGGTQIGYSAFGIMRDKKIWGEDADVFRPERWIQGSSEKIKEGERALELVFAYGKYRCLGQNVALMELNKVFVELLRRFDFSIVDPTRPWNSKCIGAFAQKEMWMMVTRREDGVST